ncbi:MAG: ACT domain-containing protein [Gammaproteobacteria bacterium]|nr:MAG: ACT domain-containing protein [Gammaproteobacteria bacterium]
MKIKQISVFLENKPGHLSSICKLLADAQINIVTISLADTEDFGIVRLIVKEWEKAQQLLTDNGATVKVTELVAAEVEDKPGGLNKILEIIDSSHLNIEYMYAFTYRAKESAIMVFRFNNPEEAIALLSSKDVKVISEADLFAITE